MPDIDWKEILGGLKDAVVLPVKEGAKDLLDANKDARDFLEDRAKRLAELGVEYLKAENDAARESVKELMVVVQQSIRNEVSQVAVGASIESRKTFAKVLDAAVGVLIKAIPIVVAAI